MKRTGVIIVFAMFSFLSVSPKNDMRGAIAASELSGKDVFLKYKCDACHSVSTADVRGKKDKGPDLVNVTARHEEAWLRSFMQKATGHVSCAKVPKERNGKEHIAKFKGTKEEEDALLKWLNAQRKD